MKTRILTIAILSLVLVATGCKKGIFCTKGDGPDVEVLLDLPPLEGIELRGTGNVFLHKGEEQEVLVTGQQNIIDKLHRDVKGTTWIIDYEGCIRGKSDLRIDITVPEINHVKITGSGDVHGEDTFNGISVLDLTITGSGSIDFAGEAVSVEAEVTGSGDITLAGSAVQENFRITGSGSMNAFGMEASKCDVKISGSGDCYVFVNDELNVTITGSGNVHYEGNPYISTDISGSGNIINDN